MEDGKKEDGYEEPILNMDADSLTTASAGSTSTTTTPAALSWFPEKSSNHHNKHKRRVSKAFRLSPKKWRRMMRTHRLQSILIGH